MASWPSYPAQPPRAAMDRVRPPDPCGASGTRVLAPARPRSALQPPVRPFGWAFGLRSSEAQPGASVPRKLLRPDVVRIGAAVEQRLTHRLHERLRAGGVRDRLFDLVRVAADLGCI